MTDRNTRLDQLKKALKERIIVLDGAMGTMIQNQKLDEAAFRGDRFKDYDREVQGNNDLLNLTQPALLRNIHAEYLDAGADIIETNTFNSTRLSQADYGMEELARELNVASARLAREIADEYTAKNPDKPRFVAGAVGPTSRTASLSPDVNNPGYRNVDFQTLVDNYYEAVSGLVEGGSDLILIETIFDTLNAKAAIYATQQFFEDSGIELPIMISGNHYRCFRPNPVRPDYRGVLQFRGPRQADFHWPELRLGCGCPAPLCGRTVQQSGNLCLRPPQRRPAQRIR